MEKITIYDILLKVSEKYRISVEQMKGKERYAEIVKARHIYFYLCRKLTSATYYKIAKLLNRDHSTVIHAENKIADEIYYYRHFEQEINDLIVELQPLKIVVSDINLLQLSEIYGKKRIKSA